MNMLSLEMKKRSANAALGSVRAEGLAPSAKVIELAKRYINGDITKQQLRLWVVKEIKFQNSNS